ncbi:EpsD family peptidyl-prolyl cis-trans isomerase [Pelomonas sp. SE-A7]|uniref:EpsD family peptidyl-prolyl cis-trans isomerase n=1 Tax=Pelomonas sp. SE-A7 TaxID=3054953 RepID=UPI00259CB1F6|nr:EpsD family peptidyl-prolyl cis-trans isomerase [Pelomonas sp. SE-A7]MDM4766039.1 EpsD family peptidyl-prolyl cis-trans isomerase [Pelomonas sp. SE-A7]
MQKRFLVADPRSSRVLAIAAAAGLAALLVACGGGNSKTTSSQPAAKVNQEAVTIDQINQVLSRQNGLKAEQTEAAGRQVLERLIDQELLVQKAMEQKLDKDGKVQQMLEAARREVLARAYAERIGDAVAKPTEAEVAAYYASKPNLFKDRRVYNLQEFLIEANAEQFGLLRSKLSKANNIGEFVKGLQADGRRFNVNQAVRAAEQLPAAVADDLAKLKEGQSLLINAPAGMQLVYVNAVRSQPIDEARAKPLIEQLLLAQRKSEAASKEMKALRDAAKIEYIGKFADKPAGAAASAPADAASSLLAPVASEPTAK